MKAFGRHLETNMNVSMWQRLKSKHSLKQVVPVFRLLIGFQRVRFVALASLG